MVKTITPRLSEPLYENLKHLVNRSDRFASVNQFVNAAIREKLHELLRSLPVPRDVYRAMCEALDSGKLVVAAELEVCEVMRTATIEQAGQSAPATQEQSA